jgi:hypothetical protein
MLEKEKKKKKDATRTREENQTKESARQAIDIDTLSKKIIWTNRTSGRTDGQKKRTTAGSCSRTQEQQKITFR